VIAASHIAELKRLVPQCCLPDQVRIGSRMTAALRRLRQGEDPRAPWERWLAEARGSVALRERRGELAGKVGYPPDLPISAHREAIVAALRQHQVVVVAGETGSGKTTQLPKMCLEAGFGARARIGCTQPRRVAAVSISERIAEELNVAWGHEVGCKIRFSDHSRPETSLKVMTDGILLAEVQGDPLLTEYEVILLDEAHERSLNIDFLLGYLRQLVKQRDDLKVVITSATIDTELFSRAFNGAPIIEVSGRLYPVETRYEPIDEASEEEGEETYVDAAVRVVGNLLQESAAGDVLVFMPGERDIRETCDDLEKLERGRIEVLPLFGRLTSEEQHRIFAPGPRRRVVVATNIAETSITVPRIRYVVDTGLARISRYHPGTRSRRLPVEPIPQSSANQRKGRCGRVADGICVRLYAEADFTERRPFAEPEIQRCNLADVILRMKAYRLGEVETFPFLEPPTPQAIHGAYDLLQELGALDEKRQLTPLGGDIARLPVDPSIGRMVLQARHENAIQEVLVIAAGLSVQDPRERPLDRKDAAETAHRRFQHPTSDFLTLLNIWNAFHDTWESLKTQSQLRKFCKAHFLSFIRMREWVDIHTQLSEALQDLEDFRENRQPASYEAVHHSILTGLLGHVAERKERNIYRVAGNRQVYVFPGSGLFEKPGKAQTAAKPPHQRGTVAATPSQPAWLVAGEIVETSQVYARTVAGIEPEWVMKLAPHLCRHAYDNVRWEAEAGRVLARERVMFRGLVLKERQVGYGRVEPAKATEVFIRSALVEEDLPGQHAFLEHNRQLRDKLELWQSHQHQRIGGDLDEALYQFYAVRLKEVSSVPDLNRVVKEHAHRQWLCATAADLLGEEAARFSTQAFPDTVPLGNQAVEVRYAYARGQDQDGVTLRLAAPLAEVVDMEQLDWVVPSLREERMRELLRQLPKALRRPLMPLDATARAILEQVEPAGCGYLARVSEFLRRSYSVEVPADAWQVALLPPHLRPRVELVGQHGKVVAVGRDLPTLREQARKEGSVEATQDWKTAVRQWEKYRLSGWEFGDLPEQVVVSRIGGFDLLAYPALQVENEEVHLRLFRQAAEAAAAHAAAVPRLAEAVLGRETAWLRRELKDLKKHGPYYATLGPAEELLEGGWENLREYLFALGEPAPRTAAAFSAYVERARQQIPGLSVRFCGLVGQIMEKRHQALMCRKPLPQMRAEIDALVPRDFLRRIPFTRLAHLPRYLQALIVRAERAALNSAKDAEKAARVRPYLEALNALAAKPTTSEARRALVGFWALLEEYKVSCFAQELGTAEPVSPRRLDEALAVLRNKALGRDAKKGEGGGQPCG